MKKQALLIIDIQNDYFSEGKMALDNCEQTAQNASKILEHFREKDQPIIHIQHESVKPGATFFIPGTEGVKIHEYVFPSTTETIIVKNFPNSFRETGLKKQLNKLYVEELVITGMMSNMCVDATTRAAFDLGYKCTVIHDACCAASLEFNNSKVDSEQVHTAFMAALGSVYADMIATSEFIGE